MPLIYEDVDSQLFRLVNKITAKYDFRKTKKVIELLFFHTPKCDAHMVYEIIPYEI